MGALQDVTGSPPLDCRPNERPVRSSVPPYRWECRPRYLAACPPRELTERLDELKAWYPDAYAAGCRVFDPRCRLPPGWIAAWNTLPSPAPPPNAPPSTGPNHVIMCPPSCFVYEDAPPTADDPLPYCCPGHPDCPPDVGEVCGGRPCPSGSGGTGLHPHGWSHPDYPWFDSYQICCKPPSLGFQTPPTKPPEAPRPTPRFRASQVRRTANPAGGMEGCLQDCWGLANKEQYEACRYACFCVRYPSTCLALRDTPSGAQPSPQPIPGITVPLAPQRHRAFHTSRTMRAMHRVTVAS